MLVKFRTDAGDVIMFGDVAVTLLKMMGKTGALPGALVAKDVPAALERLKRAAAAAPESPGNGKDAEMDAEPKVSLMQRAYPLVQLFSRCVEKNCDVMWEEELPMFAGKSRG